MNIDIYKLISGEKELLVKEITLKSEDLNISDMVELYDDVKCEVSIYRTDEDIVAYIDSEYDLKECCDRCLKEFPKHYHVKGEYFLRNEDNGRDNIILVEENNLNLSEIIAEIILLNRDYKNICSEKCMGLCPKCGADRNIKQCSCDDNNVNPQMMELQKLLDKEV